MDEELLNIADFQKIVKLYHEESDRAAAVLAGSFVDGFLAKFLRHFLAKEPEVEKLFDSYGPFGTFAARMDCSFAFGLIYRDVWEDLTYVRKIRNHFAHHPAETSFNGSPVRDWCACLSTAKVKHDEKGGEYHVTEPRLQYLFVVSRAVAVMHNTMLTGKKWL